MMPCSVQRRGFETVSMEAAIDIDRSPGRLHDGRTGTTPYEYRAIRQALGLSRRELAERLGCETSAVKKTGKSAWSQSLSQHGYRSRPYATAGQSPPSQRGAAVAHIVA